MTAFFLIPLAIALVAIYLYRQAHEEIVAAFLMAIFLLSLLVSFILAHWIAQILMLASGLGALRYFCHRHSCQDSWKPED